MILTIPRKIEVFIKKDPQLKYISFYFKIFKHLRNYGFTFRNKSTRLKYIWFIIFKILPDINKIFYVTIWCYQYLGLWYQFCVSYYQNHSKYYLNLVRLYQNLVNYFQILSDTIKILRLALTKTFSDTIKTCLILPKSEMVLGKSCLLLSNLTWCRQNHIC